MISKKTIIKNKLKLIVKIIARIFHKLDIYLHRVLKLILKPFKKVSSQILERLPHRLRVKIHNLQRKIQGQSLVKEHKRLSAGLAFALVIIPIFVGIFGYIQNRNNQQFATDQPWNEKIADGAWIKHNQEPVSQPVNTNQFDVDLNLKEVINVEDFVGKAEASESEGDIAKPFDTLGYRWVVEIYDGTYFEFGGVSSNTPEGKVLPVVRARKNTGEYVAFSPKNAIKDYGLKNENENNNQKSKINNQYVTPKVEGNVISWEISDGVTARYTMMQDRVKADYIVKDQKSISNNQLDFDLEYSDELEILENPGESLSFIPITEDDQPPGLVEEAFIIPAPEIIDSKGYKFFGNYEITEEEYGSRLKIVMPAEELAKSSFPLTVDPVLAINTNSGALRSTNGNNLTRDEWGNLIAVVWAGADVYYKSYDSNTWVDTGIRIGSSNTDYQCTGYFFATDMDSYGDVHIAYQAYYSYNPGSPVCGTKQEQSVRYLRVNVTRDGENRITGINASDFKILDETAFAQGTSNFQTRPTLNIANKGAGVGEEKVVISYGGHDNVGRTEFRVIQKDVWDVGYDDLILSDENLVGYWGLNEQHNGYEAVDASSTGNDGTYNGTPTMLASPAAILGNPENTAVTFNGSTDYVQVPDNNAYDFGTGDFSIEFWIDSTTWNTSANEYLVSHGGGGVTGSEWETRTDTTEGQFSSRIGDAVTYTVTSGSDSNFVESGWNHMVLVMDRDGNGQWYRNGYAYGSPTDISGASGDLMDAAYDLYIGDRRTATCGADDCNFTGSLDEVAVYSDALTPAEIQEHYEKGRETYYSNVIKATPALSGYWRLGTPSGTIAYDDSGNGNHGTIQDSPTLGADGATGIDNDTAITFDGTTDNQVIISDDDALDFGTGDYSIEAWVKRSSAPSASEYIIAKSGGGTIDDWELYQDGTGSNCLSARVGNGTTYNGTTCANIADGRWHHVVFTADRDGSGTFYIDGVVDGEEDISGDSDHDLTNTDSAYIGSRITDGNEWTGSIDEVAIYKGVALTADQVREHYQAANSWKNTTEERHSNGGFGNCKDIVTGTGTTGAVGLGDSMYCTGASDAVIYDNTNAYIHGVLEQIPGTPARNPDSVKFDDNGSFSELSNTIDGDRGSTNEINSFTTTDYLYVGDSKPFSKVTFDMYATNSATSDFAVTDVEYCSLSYDGTTCDSWTDLSNFYDNTDDGTSAFSEDGSLLFDEPDNWETVTVNSTSGKYWIRIRPDAAMDSDVKIAEITVNHRNSNALLFVGGSGAQAGLQPATVPWDDITNENWENRADSTGRPWYEGDPDVGFWGFTDDTYTARWTYQQGFPLSAAVDHINNQFYVSFQYDEYVSFPDPFYEYVFSVGDNKDPIDRDNWINTGFPEGGWNHDVEHNMVTVDNYLLRFAIADPNGDFGSGISSPVNVRVCTPHFGGDPKICDSADDWGEMATLSGQVTRRDGLDVISTKISSDTLGIEYLIESPTDGDVAYERLFMDLNDRKKIGAASGDDAYHRDCDTGTHDQNISDIVVKLGREDADSSCSSGDSENHAGFRFQSVDVAPGAKISSAYIDFRVASRSATTGNLDFVIYGEDTDNSSAYTALTDCTPSSTCTGIVDERTKTTSSSIQSIDFEGDPDEGISYRFDVTDIVQEIVCRGVIDTQPCVGDFNGSGAWASGNALSILFQSNEGGGVDNWINIFSYDDTQGILEPTLQINCGDSCDEPKPQEAEWCEIGPASGQGSNDCNSNWLNRKKVTFDNRASGENLTNFPVLLRFDNTKIDYSKVQNAGQDLRFVAATGGATLRYDIDEWNEDGESLVWVNVPQIDAGSNTDYIYMYYNNASASAGMNEEETYESNIELVAHLHEDPSSTCSGTDEVCDSSRNNYHLNGFGTAAWTSGDSVNGVIGKAIDFDGTDQYFQRAGTSNAISALPGGNSARTMEGWFRTTNADAVSRALLGYGQGTGAEDININMSVGVFRLAVRIDNTNFGEGTANVWNDGEWHHAVVSYDGTDATAYLDGVQWGAPTTPGTTPNTDVDDGDTDNNENLNIGRLSNYWAGSLDEMRLHTGARSPDYVEASYLNMKPNSTFASFGEEESDPTVSDYEALITGNSSLGAYYRLDLPANYTEFIQSLDPAGYWPLDDFSGDFNDASGNGFDVTPSGDPTYARDGPNVNGISQRAVEFDGSGDYALVDESVDDSVTTSTGMMVSLWFRTTGINETLVNQNYDSTNRSWEVYTNGSGQIIFESFQSSGSQHCFVNGGTANDGNWHHVVAWVEPTTNYCGIVVDYRAQSASNGTPTGTWNAEINQPLSIGALSIGTSAYDFTGDLAHVAYWDSDLDSVSGVAGDIRVSLYNGLLAVDSTGNARHAAPTDSSHPYPGVKGLVLGESDNTAWSFDGSDDRVYFDNSVWNPWGGDFSINAWVKTDLSTGTYRAFISSESYLVNGFRFGRRGNDFAFWTDQSIPSGGFVLDSNSLFSDLTLGQAYMVTVTRTGDDFYLYVNGELADSDTAGSYVAPGNVGTNIGSVGGGHWDGVIDDVSIFTDVLTQTEIAAMYDAGKASHYQKTILNTNGLVAYWRLGEGGGTTAVDEMGTHDGTYTSSPTLGVAGGIQGDNDTAVDFVANSYVQLTDHADLDAGSSNSWEFWVKRNTIQDDTNFYSKATGGNFYGMANGTFRLGNDSGTVATSTSTALDDSEWHHVVVTYAGSGAGNTLIYIDGEEGHTDGPQISTGLASNATNPRIGAYALGLLEDSLADIDEVAIYNTVLSAETIKEHYLAGGGTNRFNIKQYSKGVTSATGSASLSDLDASFSSADYVATSGDDDTYVHVSSDLNTTLGLDGYPTYMLKVYNGRNKNSDDINATAVVKSSMPSSTNPIHLQIYRGAGYYDWETIATDNSTRADTDITLTGITIDSDQDKYYVNETAGVGTTFENCTDGNSNCWTYFRVYQEGVGVLDNTILSLDSFNVSFTEDEGESAIATKVAFTNEHRTFESSVCSGTANSFTLQLQNSTGTATTPQTTTVVRVTSNTSGTATIYSDASCTNTVTNGDFTFGTSETTKTFYIQDTGGSNDYQLTGATQSGDSLTSGIHFYTIEADAPEDAGTRIRGGGDTRIRGGVRLR